MTHAGAGGAVGETRADRLGLRPLTARSVLLSVLLGSHPPELPVRALVRAGALFGIPDGTVRVALSRMVAEGDVLGGGGRYRLADRFVERQRRQDEGRAAETLPWDGSWVLAVADPAAPSHAVRAEALATVAPMRLAEWRDGLWARPANLALRWAAGPAIFRRVVAGPIDNAAGLVATLWDLDGWARRAGDLLDVMDADVDPATRFSVSAATVAHLRDDPLLPDPLLPTAWPGGELRRRYRSFEADLAVLLRASDDPR